MTEDVFGVSSRRASRAMFLCAALAWSFFSMGRILDAPSRFEAQAHLLVATATAYCLQGATSAGVLAQRGVVASDPSWLPTGSVVRLHTDTGDDGMYSVLDTGSAIVGQRIDIFIPNCVRALRFGRRPVALEVLRRGWIP